MTIEQHITEQASKLDLEHLTPGQRDWLHYMQSLAMLAYISKVRREMQRRTP